jgi:hypothetical protein
MVIAQPGASDITKDGTASGISQYTSNIVPRSVPLAQHLKPNTNTYAPPQNNAPSSQYTSEAPRWIADPQQARASANNCSNTNMGINTNKRTNTNNTTSLRNMTNSNPYIITDTLTSSTEKEEMTSHVHANAESNTDRNPSARLDEGLLQRLRSSYKITKTLLVSLDVKISRGSKDAVVFVCFLHRGERKEHMSAESFWWLYFADENASSLLRLFFAWLSTW